MDARTRTDDWLTLADGARHEVAGWTVDSDDEIAIVTRCGRVIPLVDDPAPDPDDCPGCVR